MADTRVGVYLLFCTMVFNIYIPLNSAVDSFSNPDVLAVIGKLQKAEIRLCPFSEPSNSGGALAPQASPLSTTLLIVK